MRSRRSILLRNGSISNPFDLDTENLQHNIAISLRRFFAGANDKLLKIKRSSDNQEGFLWLKNNENVLSENSICSLSNQYSQGVSLSSFHNGGDILVTGIFMQTLDSSTESQRLMYKVGSGDVKIVESGNLIKINNMPALKFPSGVLFNSNGKRWAQGVSSFSGTALTISSNTVNNGAGVVLSTGTQTNNRIALVNDRRSQKLNSIIVEPDFLTSLLQSQKDNSDLRLQILTKQSLSLGGSFYSWCDNEAPTSNVYNGSLANDSLTFGGQYPSNGFNGFISEAHLFNGYGTAADIDSLKQKINMIYSIYTN